MAKTTTYIAQPQERLYGYDDTRAGNFYITQQGDLCYAVHNSTFMLFDGDTLTFNTGHDKVALSPRFPLRRAPAGTTVSLVQEPESE